MTGSIREAVLLRGTAALGLLLCLTISTEARAAEVKDDALVLEQPPRYGVYYDRYEPAFYTGFAPRTPDPHRLHVHIGRGNQLRATAVLSDEVLRGYAGDLLERSRAYRALVEDETLVLTQNRGLDDFERSLADAEVARLVSEESRLAPETLRTRNLELMERLNPGRVFRIRIPVDEMMRRWLARLRPEDHQRMDAARRLELLNLMLPTRLFVADLDPAASVELTELVKRCADPVAASSDLEASRDLDALRPAFLALFARISHRIYPVRDGALDFAEFTAVYPIGTWNQTATVGGRQIPEYPTPGRRALTTHQRTLTIDHIPIDATYSYFPWLPYMHVGTRLHNALHTLFWRMKPEETGFLPPAWREARNSDGKPYEYLWLLSRGPMSHGCTHVNAGHIAELRQLLPVETDEMGRVDVFYNKTAQYDVFDIDGDFAPEVMGVRYFIAFSLQNDRPHRLRVRDERRAYYDWLYGGELGYDAGGRGVFARASDARFAGRTAVGGAEYKDIALFEADYEPERIQFYRLVDIPFARELRKVGVESPFDEARRDARRQGDGASAAAATSSIIRTAPD